MLTTELSAQLSNFQNLANKSLITTLYEHSSQK